MATQSVDDKVKITVKMDSSDLSGDWQAAEGSQRCRTNTYVTTATKKKHDQLARRDNDATNKAINCVPAAEKKK